MDEKLKDVKCFLLDMDGTVYLSGVLLPGAKEAVERMRCNARVIFLTNNTSVARKDYVKKLCALGIDVVEDDIYTAGNATVDYLNSRHKGKSVFLLGTEKLRAEFKAGGVLLTDVAPDLVVVGFDTNLTYRNLSAACGFIRSGVPYLATHPDLNCPVADGYIPDVGSFLALIRTSTGKEPFIVCGKPHAPIAEGVAQKIGASGKSIAMVGDRLSTDMRFAVNNGYTSVLVLSGEATKKDLETGEFKVDVVLNSIADYK